MSKRLDLIGKKFGKLTVIKRTKLILKRIRSGRAENLQEYECLCDCGEIKLVTCHDLKRVLKGSGTSSCGCSMRKVSGNWSSAFNIVWKNYVCHAKRANRDFKLTKEEFFSLTSSNCHYCGVAPHLIKKTKSKRNPTTYTYNGIDRVDNNIGYVYSNCVSCCEVCNRMKLTMGLYIFLEHIKRIYKHSINNS
jgi:hypothetical protein